ncbi:hypothetical protein SK128_025904 [Halocaridina rubra]|uniref:Uncharacterized protein n=1 Tax=Halocaridina rubra TaxID=373956 RepID=A0AAN8ZYE5_HALRR
MRSITDARFNVEVNEEWLEEVERFKYLGSHKARNGQMNPETFGNQKLGLIAWTISLFVACSIFGSLNGGIMTFSRVLYAGAREGQLPKCFSLVHINNKTPGVAIIASLIGSSVVIFANDYASILAYLSFAMNLMNLLCVLAFLWFRYNQPERHRPIKAWFGFPAVYLVLTIFVTIFPVIEQPIEIATASAALLLGLLVYYLAIYKKNKTIGRCMGKYPYVQNEPIITLER